MNRPPNILIYIIFVSLILLPLVDPLNIPGTAPVPPDVAISEHKDGSTSLIESADKTEYRKSTKINIDLSDEAAIDIKSPLEITKSISPKSRDGFLVGDTLRILVEIKRTGSDVNSMRILERIDPSLELLIQNNFTSKCYVANNFKQLNELYIALNENNVATAEDYLQCLNTYDISPMANNSFIININTRDILSSKGRLAYCYYVKPKQAGIFNTETNINIDGNYPDIDVPLEIGVNDHNPKFSTDLDVNDLDVDFGDPVNLIYNIQYIGGSLDPYCCEVKLVPSDEYTILGNECCNKSFKLYQREELNTSIKYLSTGKHYPPGITINNSMPYTFKDQEIVVRNWRQRNISELSIFATILVGLLSTLIYDIRSLHKQQEDRPRAK